MNMSLSNLHGFSRISETFCPFDGVTTCLASLSLMPLDTMKRKICCGTEQYDECPIFLAKVLRRG
jgi:hypothetical protein